MDVDACLEAVLAEVEVLLVLVQLLHGLTSETPRASVSGRQMRRAGHARNDHVAAEVTWQQSQTKARLKTCTKE